MPDLGGSVPLNHHSEYSALTEAQYAAIGRAVVEWANVEFLLGVLLSRLLATPEFLARTMYDLLFNYPNLVRLLAVPFIALDVLIVRYLFRSEVRRSCNAFPSLFSRLKRSSDVLFHLDIYLFVSGVGSELIGIGAVLAVLMGFGAAQRYKRTIEKAQDIATAPTGSAIRTASR
jgi:hypothetical protein